MRATAAGIPDGKCKMQIAKCKFCRGLVTKPLLIGERSIAVTNTIYVLLRDTELIGWPTSANLPH